MCRVTLERPVVSQKQVMNDPYPYVYIDHQGVLRELTPEERQYLETPYQPADGDRPYVKLGPYSRTPDGSLRGFVRRSKLPRRAQLGKPLPPRSWWRIWP